MRTGRWGIAARWRFTSGFSGKTVFALAIRDILFTATGTRTRRPLTANSNLMSGFFLIKEMPAGCRERFEARAPVWKARPRRVPEPSAITAVTGRRRCQRLIGYDKAARYNIFYHYLRNIFRHLLAAGADR